MASNRILTTLAATAALAAALAPAFVHAQTGMMELKGAAMPITVVYPTAAISPLQSLGPFEI